MSAVVFLDASPLGLVTNPNRSATNVACTSWLQSLLKAGRRVIVPEITDYEVRRELIRANRAQGIANLDSLPTFLDYLPITTAAMRKAAELWAAARARGQPTAGDPSIDADAILAGQALTLGVPDVIVATTNLGHLQQYVSADVWQNIHP